MEPIKTMLPQAVGKMELLKSSQESNKTLLPEERQIMEVKYAAPCFSRLPPEELLLVADVLMLKIHVISGWNIPEGPLNAILTDQFSKKLIESYPTVNAEEMEYAFRNFPVKDWGKSMNLNLVDEVMSEYLAKRSALSKLEESESFKLMPPTEITTTDEEFIEAALNLYRMDLDYKRIPAMVYGCLEKKLDLSREEKNRIKAHVDSIDKGTPDLYKQWAVKEYFDKLPA